MNEPHRRSRVLGTVVLGALIVSLGATPAPSKPTTDTGAMKNGCAQATLPAAVG